MLAVIWKDLVLEARGRETIAALWLLGVLVLVLFNFAIVIDETNAAQLSPGILWIAIAFSSTLALGRAFAIERENGCMSGLLLAPVDRGSLFLAKLVVNTVLLLVYEAMLLPFFFLFFGSTVSANLPGLALVLIAGSLGLAGVGTLFALAALGTRARELMLPLLILPLQVPLLIAAVRATDVVLAGGSASTLGVWGQLLVGFDVVSVVSGWLVFEYMTVD